MEIALFALCLCTQNFIYGIAILLARTVSSSFSLFSFCDPCVDLRRFKCVLQPECLLIPVLLRGALQLPRHANSDFLVSRFGSTVRWDRKLRRGKIHRRGEASTGCREASRLWGWSMTGKWPTFRGPTTTLGIEPPSCLSLSRRWEEGRSFSQRPAPSTEVSGKWDLRLLRKSLPHAFFLRGAQRFVSLSVRL